MASSLHGIPRSTQDVDLVAGVQDRHVPLLVDALQSQFYISGETIRDAIRRVSTFNLIHLETMFKVDVFVLSKDEPSQQEMSRRASHQVSDDPRQTLFLASAEVQADRLDHAYLNRRARGRGITELLERALGEADLTWESK